MIDRVLVYIINAFLRIIIAKPLKWVNA